ncbi:tubulin glycylase 3E isoform X2 [Hydra vulgaris]|uniref:Tubulin glycylase 3E isoform X2 n=1 Tax=Hydra vulgaris TaxID=6087 RepID=A0ABM4DDX0_HYDVU
MKIGYQKDLTWTVVKAKKKKRSRNEKNHTSFWNEEEKNEENDMDFEVVFKKQKDVQKNSSKDKKKKHCLVEKFSDNFSDSEIEVVLCPDENCNPQHRSNVLNNNLLMQNDCDTCQPMQLSFEGFKELLNEDFFLEDSDIEVLDKTSNVQSTSNRKFKELDIAEGKKINNESLEIIFDENWHAGLFEGNENLTEKEKINIGENNENKVCLRYCVSECFCEQLFEPYEKNFSPTKYASSNLAQDKSLVDSDDEEYGIKTLFEKASYDFEEHIDNTKDVMTMKTSTLAIFFCISIIVAVHAGNGFGFAKEKSPTLETTTTPPGPAPEPSVNEKKDLFHDSNFENINFKLLRASSETKSALKTLLTSLRLLQEKHRQLQEIHDETMKNFNIQKQMTWYWRRKVTLIDHNENDDEKFKSQERKNNRFLIAQFEDVIQKLNISLEEAKLEAKMWKKKFFSSKLQNIPNSILNKNFESNTYFSKCFFHFSNALNDARLLNLSKPMDTPLSVFKKDSKTAWRNIKNNWKSRKSENENFEFDEKTSLLNKKKKNHCIKKKRNYYIELADAQKNNNKKVNDKKINSESKRKSTETANLNEKIPSMTNETKTVIIDCGDRQIKVVTEDQFPEQPAKVKSTYCKINGIAITVLEGKVQIVSAVDNKSLNKTVSTVDNKLKKPFSEINNETLILEKLDTKISQKHSNRNKKDEIQENKGVKDNTKFHLQTNSSEVQSILLNINQKISIIQVEQRNSSQRINKEIKYCEEKIEKMTASFLGDKEYFAIENEKLTRRLEKLESQLNQVINQTKVEAEKDLKKERTQCKIEYDDRTRRTSEERKSQERINKIAFYKTKLQQAVKEIKYLKKKLQVQVKFFKREALIEILGKKINTYRRLLQERNYPNDIIKKNFNLQGSTSSFYKIETNDRVPLALNTESNKKVYYGDNSLNLHSKEDIFHILADKLERPPESSYNPPVALEEKNIFFTPKSSYNPPVALEEKNIFFTPESSYNQNKLYQPENHSKFSNKQRTSNKQRESVQNKGKPKKLVMKTKTRNKNLVKNSSTLPSPKPSLSKTLKNTPNEKKVFSDNKKVKKQNPHKTANPTDFSKASENLKLQTKEDLSLFTGYTTSMHQTKTCDIFQKEKTDDDQNCCLKKSKGINFSKVTKPSSLRVTPPKSLKVKSFPSLSIDNTLWYFDSIEDKYNNNRDDEDEPFYLN